jgi:hypothetical protein
VKTPSSVSRSALPTLSPLPPQPTCAPSPGLATPHARGTEATPLSRSLPLPRQGPETAQAWAGPTGLPGGSRKGSRASAGDPFLESPGTERKTARRRGSGLLFSGRTTARKQQVRTTGNGFSTRAPSPVSRVGRECRNLGQATVWVNAPQTPELDEVRVRVTTASSLSPSATPSAKSGRAGAEAS